MVRGRHSSRRLRLLPLDPLHREAYPPHPAQVRNQIVPLRRECLELYEAKAVALNTVTELLEAGALYGDGGADGLFSGLVDVLGEVELYLHGASRCGMTLRGCGSIR